MTQHDNGDDRFAEIAESFVERYQRGERPSVDAYVAAHPEFEEQIRELFPALEVLEELAPDSAGVSSLGPTTELDVPATIGGYRIVREIGRGGMGIVYEAEQPGLHRRVALKVLPAHVRKDEAALERFRRESQAAAGLQHPNIVPVYEVGEDETHAFYVMQFVDGQGLDAVLTELRKMRNATPRPGDDRSTSEEIQPATFAAKSLLTGRFLEASESDHDSSSTGSDAVTTSIGLLPEFDSTADAHTSACYRSLSQVASQAARALAHAHSNGVVHRDIKPSNLMLDSSGNVWVTDFGLAKGEEDDLTQTGDIIGTLRYMAPERFRGWADPRSDVYSMGMTLYEMLALRPAFATIDRARLMQQITETGPPRPRTVDARIPHDLETIVLKAIEREPAHRYQSADELAGDLDRYLADKPILARRSTWAERILRWGRRNPLTAVLISGIALLLLIGSIVSMIAVVRFSELAASESESAAAARVERTNANNARKQTEQANLEVTRQLIRLKVAAALQAQEVGDDFTALVRHTEALKLARERKLDETLHRIRIGRLMKSTPKLEALWSPKWTHPDNPPRSRPAFFILSPDGTRAIRGSGMFADGRPLELWDTRSGRRLAILLEDGRRSYLSRFSANSAFVVVGDAKGRYRVWNARSGKPIGPTIEHGGHTTATLSRDGSRLLIRCLQPVRDCRLWDVASGKVLLNLTKQDGGIERFMIDPDERHFATITNKAKVQFWNFNTLKPVTGRMQLAHSNIGVAFSRDVEWIAARDTSKTAWAFNLVTRKQHKLTHEFSVRKISFTPDGGTVICRGDKKVSLWDVGTGLRVATVSHSRQILRALSDEHGNRLILIERNRPRGAIVCELGANKQYALRGEVPFDPRQPIPGAAGQLLLPLIHGRHVIVFDIETGSTRHVLRHRHLVGRANVLDDGRHLLTVDADRNVQVWDGSTGRAVTPLLPHHVGVLEARYNATTKTVTTIDTDDIVRLWSIAPFSKRAVEFRHKEALTALSWSPDGSQLLTASYDKTARLWNPVNRKPIATLKHDFVVRDAFYSSDARWIATSDINGSFYLWDAKTARRVANPRYRGMRVTGVLFSPDSKRLLTYGNGLRLWDLTTQPLKMIMHIEQRARRVAFDPTGQFVVVGGNESRGKKSVTVYNLTNGKLVKKLQDIGNRVVTSVAWSRDGKTILATRARTREVLTRAKLRELYASQRKRSPGEFFLWDAKTFRQIAQVDFASGIRYGTFTPDSRFLVTAGDNGAGRVWSALTGKAVTGTFRHDGRIRHADVQSNGMLIATASNDATARVWDARTGEPIAILPHESSVTFVRFSPDGTRVATAGDNGSCRVFGLQPEKRTVARLQELSQFLSSRRLTKQGEFAPLTSTDLRSLRRRDSPPE